MLVVNKIDLAEMVGADVDVMRRDSARMRGERPSVFVSLRQDQRATPIADWIRLQLHAWQAA